MDPHTHHAPDLDSIALAARQAQSQRPPMLPIARPDQPPVVQTPVAPMTDAGYRVMLAATASIPMRRCAIDALGNSPREESLALLLEHARRETNGELIAETVLALTRAGANDSTGRVPTRLVDMFAHASDLRLRAAILACFRTRDRSSDRPHLEALARLAKPGEEVRKVAELIARHDAAGRPGPTSLSSPSGAPR